ncbi:MAG: O-antigen ligase family protein [Bacteroidetes bacterium]|nr:MAG: O-antigen ligase family protein [Bacteroidota bacterium]MBL1145528.1 O-antigen ligase family protein [Bacteroidota bacterium]NOG58325.1 O-antigen ligase family protein [Bacteroidota bacterium]
MNDYLKSNGILILCFLFIMANSALIALEQYWFSIVPFAILILMLAFVATDKLMWFIVFTTPLSLNLEALEFGGIGMFLPTEPLLFGVMLIFFIKLLYDKTFDKDVLKHPLTIVILINLAWIILTTITSTLPIVSLKFLLARMWFVIAFYFIGTQLFKTQKNIVTFFWLYVIPLSGVALYTFIHHSTHAFAERPAHWVMQPFFKDHTVYGAVIAMMFPILLSLFGFKKNKKYTLILILMTFVFLAGIVFSYGRAAWISLIIAFLVSLIYLLRINGKLIFSVSGLLAIFLIVFWTDIVNVLEKNDQDSTSENLQEHVQSITNISTDASNLERINRWRSAIRMFEAKPILGWGPGTYAFQYAPFQSSEDLTIISTNSGDGGNAHSEFIGPLAEEGLLGALSFVLIIIVFYYKSAKLYYRLPKGELRQIVFWVTIAFTTYIVNGTLNNFLDTDKASVPFWAFIAIITAIDINQKSMINEETQLQEK